MSKLVVMLGHRARVGKDTLAAQLKKMGGYVHLAFATKLKQTVQDLYLFSDDQMYGDAKDVPDPRYPDVRDATNSLPLTPRQILQCFGQDQRRLCPAIWANFIVAQIEASENPFFVISDFRFENEYWTVRKWADNDPDNRKVVTIRIDRPDIVDFSGSADISEIELSTWQGWDHILENNSTPEALYKQYWQIMSE